MSPIASAPQPDYILERERHHHLVHLLSPPLSVATLPCHLHRKPLHVQSSWASPRVAGSAPGLKQKVKVMFFPPHCLWYCAINPVPGHGGKHRGGPAGGVYQTIHLSSLHQLLFCGEEGGQITPLGRLPGIKCHHVEVPLPTPTARYFTKLDLRDTYKLVCIQERDKWKTAFSTASGQIEWCYIYILVMLYRLANSHSVFQSLVNNVLCNMLGSFVFANIDDILIYSTSLSQYVQHFRQVFNHLLARQLYVKAEKCGFHQMAVSFLGYIIGPEGVRMERQKVKMVTSWPVPNTCKNIQRFLRFAKFYRRFIWGFSSVAAPLSALLQEKSQSLFWNKAAQAVFLDWRRSTVGPCHLKVGVSLPICICVLSFPGGLHPQRWTTTWGIRSYWSESWQ